jgi:hypothetical protein
MDPEDLKGNNNDLEVIEEESDAVQLVCWGEKKVGDEGDEDNVDGEKRNEDIKENVGDTKDDGGDGDLKCEDDVPEEEDDQGKPYSFQTGCGEKTYSF